MASLRLLRVLGQDRVGPSLLSVVRPFHWRCVAQQSPCRFMIAGTLSAAALSHSMSADHVNLHELVSQGRYCEAVDQWEKAKEEGVADSALYTSVMKMAAQVGGAEAVQSVKEDMDRQGWSMDHNCSLHYLGCLAKEGHVQDAFKFVKSSPNLTEDPLFLAECADLLAETGHPQAALDVCALLPSPPSSPSHHIPLLTVQLETLGRLGREKEMEELVVERICGDSVPPEVQFAMANAWCLAHRPARALELLKGLRSTHRHIPVKNLALLLESAQREENFTLAAEACSLFWNKSTAQPSEAAILSSPSCLPHHTSYHCRALTAAFCLQAFAHRDTANVESSGSGQLRNFLERNFFQELLQHRYLPSPHMYQALVLLSCHHSPALSWADSVIKQCRATGQVVPASSLTSWGRDCGTISPTQALKVIHMVRAHRHHYQLELDLGHYGDLLAIHYTCNTIASQKEALNCIRAIKNSMDTWGVLHTTEAYNLVLRAVVAIPAVGAHYTTYNDMMSSHVDPDLETFHLLLDGTLAEGSVKNTKKAAYYLWRRLMKEWPRVKPDVELVNKFIRCCLVCGDAERGLVFLSALSDCSVEPNVHTFTLLLQLCHSTHQRESFESVLKLAGHCLPDQASQVRALAHELQRQWRAQEDISLAVDILNQLDTSR